MVGIQRTINQRADLGVAGLIYDMDNKRVVSLANANLIKELYTVTVNSAADSDYTITLTTALGETVVATYAQGAAGTVENKVDGMVSACVAALSEYGVAAVKTSASTFTIEARVPQMVFSLVASAQMTAVNTTDAVADTAIPFGRGVVFADLYGNNCKLPATVGKVNVYGVTVGGTNDGTYILVIDGETITYTAASAGSEAVIRDGLIALINANYALRNTVKAAIKDADELYVYGLVEGDALAVADDNDTGTGSDLTVAEITVEATSDVFAGVSVFSHSEPNNTKYDLAGIKTAISGNEGYEVGASVNVLTRGTIWVETEEAVSVGDPVYVRAVISGTEVKGKFRKSVDSTDLILVPRARWVKGNTAAGLAVLELY